MAQIITITNPLTGQPAQVDQLEHTAQQIDDAVDRALQFGLGARGKELTPSDDLNTIWENGWYWWGANVPQNAPTEWPTSYPAYCMMRVWCYGVGDAIQEISSLNYDFKYTMKRICRNNVWTIEWDNPPMELGKEYRTTERWNGKPVYAMALDFGPLPNNSVNFANIPGWVSTNRAFSVNVIAHSSSETDPVPVGMSSDYSSSFWFIQSPNIYIKSRVNLSEYTSCYVYIKYTK